MKRVLFKVLSVIAMVVLAVGISVAVCLLITSCVKIGEETQLNGDRFVEISCEWHRGTSWVVVQDTKTDKEYLCVGGRSVTPME